jgi:hypothetical protein
MGSMRKMLIAALAGALVALAVGVVMGAGAVGTDDETTVTDTVTETVEAPKQEDEREAGEDISGPCDEAEHANDPRCAGTPPATGGDDDVIGDDDGVGDDISGPCDEAEHANDPRCTGAAPTPAPAPRVDNSGPGSMNSGPGNAEDNDDEVEFEDHSGPGHGGDDDGGDDHGGGSNSGPGSGDDD